MTSHQLSVHEVHLCLSCPSVLRVSSDSVFDSIGHIFHVATIQATHVDTTILQQVDVILAGQKSNLHCCAQMKSITPELCTHWKNKGGLIFRVL